MSAADSHPIGIDQPCSEAFAHRPASLPPRQIVALGRVPFEIASSGIDFRDWGVLLSAVKDRLRYCASIDDAGASNQSVGQISTTVLECVEALDLLLDSVTAELVRNERLEAEVFDARTSLAQLRAALAGTQEGERRARYLASHDALTMLPNRGLLVERLCHELARPDPRQRRFAVMFLDLNAFKPINDTYGHGIGDQMLRIVASRLRGAVRAQDVVSRVGGDEFACLIGGLSDRAQLGILARKITNSLSAPCAVGALNLVVHASIGIAVSPTDGSSADALLTNADQAMYAAKRARIGHRFFSCSGANDPVV